MTIDALIIGAGPAGLAASHALTREGIAHKVLERGDQPGYTWSSLYDSLVLHTARRLSSLPGLAFPAGTAQFPTRLDMLAYLHRYAEQFAVPLCLGANVTSLTREAGVWRAEMASGNSLLARSVIIGTGIVANPYVPDLPGRPQFRGDVIHSSSYRKPDPYAGLRVVVAGTGNSASDIAVELARAGADVTLAVRSGATVVPLQIAGVPIHYLAVGVSTLPKLLQPPILTAFGALTSLARRTPVLPAAPKTPCRNVPVIGLELLDAIRSGSVRMKGGVTGFTTAGVTLADSSELPCDAVILATGFRPAIGILGSAIHLDQCGFAERRDLVTSADQPNLYFVGHNYGIRGGIFNMRRDARLAARRIKQSRALGTGH